MLAQLNLVSASSVLLTSALPTGKHHHHEGYDTVEPPILDREITTLVEHDKTWYEERVPTLEDRVPDQVLVLPRRSVRTHTR